MNKEGSVCLSPLEKKCNKLTKLLRHDFLGEELGTSIMDYDEEEEEENDPHLMLNASKVSFSIRYSLICPWKMIYLCLHLGANPWPGMDLTNTFRMGSIS